MKMMLIKNNFIIILYIIHLLIIKLICEDCDAITDKEECNGNKQYLS